MIQVDAKSIFTKSLKNFSFAAVRKRDLVKNIAKLDYFANFDQQVSKN